MTLKELKRRARGDDPTAKRLHGVAAYGASANFLLWLTAGLSLGGAIALAAGWHQWTVILISPAAILLLWPQRPVKTGFLWQLASFLALAFARVLQWFQPIIRPLAERLNLFKPTVSSAKVYEKADLLELFKSQNRQSDNRVAETDLKLAFHALQFGDKTVGSIMRPRRSAMWVSEVEAVGPLLMNDLHADGLSAFPVVKDASKKSSAPEVIGTLYLNDLLDQPAGGKVRDIMHRQVHFINEDSNLNQALSMIGQNHHHLLIVTNSSKDIVGVLTFEQLIDQIFANKP